MLRRVSLFFSCWVLTVAVSVWAATPVVVEPVTAPHGMVVGGHPQAVAIGVEVLEAGGNAIDAAVATSLAIGVAEPYGSGLGGKLMLLYYEAKSGRTYAVDAMDAVGSVDVAAYTRRPVEDRSYGYGSVAVPGLPAGLWLAHQHWGAKRWPQLVKPAADLARQGFRVLPKTRDLFQEQERKLKRGDAEIARLYLPGGELPAAGSLLKNPDLARTLDAFAQFGRDGFYRGLVADAIVEAARHGGGVLTRDDFARYEARISEPIAVDFHGYRLVGAPPPVSGPVFLFASLKVLEGETFDGGPLRKPAHLDRIGRAWNVVADRVWPMIGDDPAMRREVERFLAPESIQAMRARAFAPDAAGAKKVVWLEGSEFFEDPAAATTHFIVADKDGNIVCATQSLSLHFGAGVVAPGTGVVLNNSMSNLTFADPKYPDDDPAGANGLAVGRRPRSTIAPTLVFRDGKPRIALGIPGGARIPTGMLQVLLDRLVLDRPLGEAIGDTRFHFASSARPGLPVVFEAELSFTLGDAAAMRGYGWDINLSEDAGRGRNFGGLNAIELNADGSKTGFADPRRTNAAAGY